MNYSALIISQNLRLESIQRIREYLNPEHRVLIVSTQLLFHNEKVKLEKIVGQCEYQTFADLLSDSIMQECDNIAYRDDLSCVDEYYEEIKRIKNEKVIENLEKRYLIDQKFILCDDLGIDLKVWEKQGYKFIQCDYYYGYTEPEIELPSVSFSKKVKGYLQRTFQKDIYVTRYQGKKMIFIGSPNRILYRLNLEFRKSQFQKFVYAIKVIWCRLTGSLPKSNKIYLSTLHESAGTNFPKHKNFNMFIMQDGYLPENYSSLYMRFYGRYTTFYGWDKLGMKAFQNQKVPAGIMPFRKKIYLPEAIFPSKIKRVLVATSGAGDWTAMKNRSDEDWMVVAFAQVAKQFPNIEFIYRCHPVWIHPKHQGVNSIQRVIEYFESEGISNIKVSSHIPENKLDNFKLSLSRSSFDDDLKGTDLVFGEHSISMVDAAMKGILFSAVNVTGRRNLFSSMTDLGFPYCETIEDITKVISMANQSSFIEKYKQAVKSYNEMTDLE